jgi:DNA invertase Pin-like site-specific DNA recombinase
MVAELTQEEMIPVGLRGTGISVLESQKFDISNVNELGLVQGDTLKIGEIDVDNSSEKQRLVNLLLKGIESSQLARLDISSGKGWPISRDISERGKGLDQSLNTTPQTPTSTHRKRNINIWNISARLVTPDNDKNPDSPSVLTDGGTSSPRLTCVIYIRVSSSRQAFDGRGTEGQLSVCEQVINARELEQVHEPIVELNAKGSDFSRQGLNDLLEVVTEESVDYVVVAHIDRLGRLTLQTLQLLSILNHGHDTVVLTPAAEIDLRTIEGTMLGTVFALVAELDNRTRGFRVQRGRADGFLNKNWKSTNRPIPYGYKELVQKCNGDKTHVWLQVSPVEAIVVRDTFDYFTNTDENPTYADTINHIKENHTVTFSRYQLKQILKNDVYIGKPTIRIRMSSGEVIEETVADESLKIIDNSTYETASSRMEDIYNKYKKSDEADVVTEITLIEQHGITRVMNILGNPFICTKDNCDGLLRNDGLVHLDESKTSQRETKVQRKECKKCGRKQKVATPWDIYRLENYEQLYSEEK